jgi:hypothetical protein
MWLALHLKKTVDVNVLGTPRSLPFSQLADDCCGVLLVFNTEEGAAAYAGEGGVIQEVAEV